ncbi:hypothetical protein GA0115238_113014 [Streptomyces sp. di50b]|nr:hypothetical protein GA0115238_113014 [Streptomyces sp. di50b]
MLGALTDSTGTLAFMHMRQSTDVWGPRRSGATSSDPYVGPIVSLSDQQ